MSETPDSDRDLSAEAPNEDAQDKAQPEASDVEVPSADDIDPDDGTDQEDKPIDNPSG